MNRHYLSMFRGRGKAIDYYLIGSILYRHAWNNGNKRTTKTNTVPDKIKGCVDILNEQE